MKTFTAFFTLATVGTLVVAQDAASSASDVPALANQVPACQSSCVDGVFDTIKCAQGDWSCFCFGKASDDSDADPSGAQMGGAVWARSCTNADGCTDQDTANTAKTLASFCDAQAQSVANSTDGGVPTERVAAIESGAAQDSPAATQTASLVAGNSTVPGVNDAAVTGFSNATATATDVTPMHLPTDDGMDVDSPDDGPDDGTDDGTDGSDDGSDDGPDDGTDPEAGPDDSAADPADPAGPAGPGVPTTLITAFPTSMPDPGSAGQPGAQAVATGISSAGAGALGVQSAGTAMAFVLMVLGIFA